MKKTVILLFVVACCLVLSTHAGARVDEKVTVMTNTPIEIPGGIVLPAGTYVFKRLDLTTGRNMVQIFNEDETQMFNTVIGIPDLKEKPPENAMIALYETEPGTPPAVRALYFSSDNVGTEFVYPKERARELAQRSGRHVMSAPTATPKNPGEQPTSSDLTEMQRQDVIAIAPDGRSIPIVEARKASEDK